MKANEAPEKIYIPTILAANTVRYKEEGSIEYIRIDAFIEKVCDFFEENIEEEDCKIGSSEWTELRAASKSLDSFIRAFVRYMKGE